MTNTDLQNVTQKIDDRETRISLKTGVKSGAPEGYVDPAPLMTPIVLLCHE